jgi:hypothetical protein
MKRISFLIFVSMILGLFVSVGLAFAEENTPQAGQKIYGSWELPHVGSFVGKTVCVSLDGEIPGKPEYKPLECRKVVSVRHLVGEVSIGPPSTELALEAVHAPERGIRTMMIVEHGLPGGKRWLILWSYGDNKVQTSSTDHILLIR